MLHLSHRVGLLSATFLGKFGYRIVLTPGRLIGSPGINLTSKTSLRCHSLSADTARYAIESIPKLHPLLLKQLQNMRQELTTLEGSTAYDQETMSRTSHLNIVLGMHSQYESDLEQFAQLQEIIDEPNQDIDLIEEALDEVEHNLPGLIRSITTLQNRLLPPIKYSDKPCIIELRPGVGGSEAALFTEDLMQMYLNYASHRKWKTSVLSRSESNNGFVNEAILSIDNPEAFGVLRNESGVHRVQRIPLTETKGRIHTSTAAVVVLPKLSDAKENEDEKEFAPGEVRIDTMRAGGKGGQHVNTTDSAVRLVHIPTGITVMQQDERSQPRNKAKAFSILRARLANLEREKELIEQRKLRTDQVVTTDRSDKIRTYNYPQNRVTDHRCGFSLHDVPGCMDGSRLEELIERVEGWEFERRMEDLVISSSNK